MEVTGMMKRVLAPCLSALFLMAGCIFAAAETEQITEAYQPETEIEQIAEAYPSETEMEQNTRDYQLETKRFPWYASSIMNKGNTD